jgi:hypothetical protein
MSTTEKELKKEEGTCSTSQCSTTDKDNKANELKVAQEAVLAAEKAKKEHSGGCCGG